MLGIGWAPLSPLGTSLVTYFTVGRFSRLDQRPPRPHPLYSTAATGNHQWHRASDCWTLEPRGRASSSSSWWVLNRKVDLIGFEASCRNQAAAHKCLVSPLKWILSPSPSPHSHLQYWLFPGLGCTILGLNHWIFLLPQRLRFGQGGGAVTIPDVGLTSSST